MQNQDFLKNLLERRNTRILTQAGEITRNDLACRYDLQVAKCLGLKAHGLIEICATFEFPTPTGKFQCRVIYEKNKETESIAPKTKPRKKKKSKKKHVKRRPILIFTGGFETNRSRH
jgi:hypothetical protein